MVVMPAVLYGAETWATPKGQEERPVEEGNGTQC